MGDAAERKKAKEAYLKALQDQRLNAVATMVNSNNAPSTKPVDTMSAAQKREAQLEERRKKFFENSSRQQLNHHLADHAHTRHDNVPIRNTVFPSPAINEPQGNISTQQKAVGTYISNQIRPSDWKSKGYQSEYAYMKAMGQLDIVPPSDNINYKINTHPLNTGNIDSIVDKKYQHDHKLSDPIARGDMNFSTFDDNNINRTKPAEHALAPPQQSQNQIAGAVSDKDAKRQKQMEYARALDQQTHFQAPIHQPVRKDGQDHSHQYHAGDSMNGGGNLNIGAVSDKDAKRQKQMEYARALDQQTHFQAPIHQPVRKDGQDHSHQYHAGDSMNGGGNLNIGVVSDKDAKRQKQMEYARALDQQKVILNNPRETGLERGGVQEAAGVAWIGGNLDTKAMADAKRQQQDEYTRQLNVQSKYLCAPKLNKFGEYEQPGRHVNPSVPSGGRSSSITSIGGDNGKTDRRTKQAEYALALRHQQLEQQFQHPVKEKYQEQQIAAAAAPSGFKPSGGLEEGWIIGPLGLPVRKTLEVGNRGVQRAYTNHVVQQLSPQKSPAHQAAGYDFHQQPQDSALNIRHEVPMGNNLVFAGAGQLNAVLMGNQDLIGGDPEDRAQKVKAQQAEQARVLEMQIRMNKERKEAEKRKLEEEEEREMQRWEVQQAEIKRAAKEEEHQRKLKVDEDNKRELERQIEMKRQEKEAEAVKERARIEREEQRVRAEQEEMRRKEEVEIRHEAEAAERQRQIQMSKIREEQRQQQMQVHALKQQQSTNGYTEIPSLSPVGALNHQEVSPHVEPSIFHRKKLFEPATTSSEDIFAGHVEKSRPSSPHKKHVKHVLSARNNDKQQHEELLGSGMERRNIASCHNDPVEEHKFAAPLVLNLTKLKRDISSGAVSARSARSGRGQSRCRGTDSPRIAVVFDRTSPMEERAKASDGQRSQQDSVFNLPANRSLSEFHESPTHISNVEVVDGRGIHEIENLDALSSATIHHAHLPVSKYQHHRVATEENQYVPPVGKQASLPSPSRTLKNESKFMLPDGTFMQSLSKPTTPALTGRWNQLSNHDADLGFQDLIYQPQPNINADSSEVPMVTSKLPVKGGTRLRDVGSPASSDTRGLIDDFKDTLQLLSAEDGVAPANVYQQRPASSGSTASDFDLERFNRRNERKWRLLQGIQAANDGPEQDVLYRDMMDVHSRPSTAASTATHESFYKIRPPSVGNWPSRYLRGGQSQGIAASPSVDNAEQARPNSAELARKLLHMNTVDGQIKSRKLPIAPPVGYDARPHSGDKNSRLLSGVAVVGSAWHKRSSNNMRYVNVSASLDDPDFDNYSDYGL